MKLQFIWLVILIISVSSIHAEEADDDEATYEDSVLRPAGEPQLIHASLPSAPRAYGTKTQTIVRQHPVKGLKAPLPAKGHPIYQKPAQIPVVKSPQPFILPARKTPVTPSPPVKRVSSPPIKRKPSILSVKQWHFQQLPETKRVQQFWAPQVPQIQLHEAGPLRKVHWTAQRPMIWSRDVYPSYNQWYRDIYLAGHPDTQQQEVQEPEGQLPQQQQEEIPSQQQEQAPEQQQQELPQQQEELPQQQEEYGQEVKSGY